MTTDTDADAHAEIRARLEARATKLEDDAIACAEEKMGSVHTSWAQVQMAHAELKLKAAVLLRERARVTPLSGMVRKWKP